MALTGIDPAARTAGDYREIFFAQGQAAGSQTDRSYMIIGNRTSAGDATVNTVFGPVEDDDAAVRKGGRRSEWYQMWKKVRAVDPTGKVYGICPTESGGTAATKTITFASGAASATVTVDVELIGESTSFTVLSGDTAVTQAAACAAAINAASNSSWPVTAAVGSNPNDHIVTVTVANKGPRSDYVLQGLRVTYRKSATTTATVSAVSSGTTDDDHTTAYAAIAAGRYYYIISPKYSTSAPTSTDDGVGEATLMVTQQALPAAGKGQQIFFGFVGTQAQATTVATDSDANNPRLKIFHAENNDWYPALLASYCAAVQALEERKHPGASLTLYRQNATINRIFSIPDPYSKNDRPTATEIEADLANGITPICFDEKGNAYMNRCVTSYTEVSAGVKDYRASEGHIPSVMDFVWDLIFARHNVLRLANPFVASDPVAGEKPKPRHMYPSTLKSMAFKLIDDLTAETPLGQYDAPILNPSKKQEMKDSVVVTYRTGGLAFSANFFAVEHYNKGEFRLNETSPSY
jgi:phage tail sheath gpL-like